MRFGIRCRLWSVWARGCGVLFERDWDERLKRIERVRHTRDPSVSLGHELLPADVYCDSLGVRMIDARW